MVKVGASPDMDGEKTSVEKGLQPDESLSKPEPKVSSPPNGGLSAWLQVLGSWSLFFNSWGLVNSFGVFQTFYTADLLSSHSSSDIAWIGSVQACLLLVVGPLTGPLFDAGYFYTLVRVGSFLVVFGMMMTSIATEYYQVLLAQGFCVGIGAGCLFIPSVAVIATYFTTRKSAATGIATTGSSIAGIVLPIAFTNLQPSIGFGWATRILAFISLGTLMIPLFVMRPRVILMSKRPLVDWSALREIPYVLFGVGVFLGFIGLYIPFFYLPTYALSVAPVSITPSFSLYLLSIMNAASVPGRLIPNFLADRTGPITIIAAASCATAILAFGWLGITSEASIIIFCILYGFFTGSFVSLPPSCIVTLSPNLGIIGTRMGMLFFIGGLGLLVGNPGAGAILKHQGGETWWGLQVYCAVFASAAAVCLCACRGFKGNWKLKAKV